MTLNFCAGKHGERHCPKGTWLAIFAGTVSDGDGDRGEVRWGIHHRVTDTVELVNEMAAEVDHGRSDRRTHQVGLIDADERKLPHPMTAAFVDAAAKRYWAWRKAAKVRDQYRASASDVSDVLG